MVLVSGAGQGLGKAHALELARQGACVLVNELDPDAAEATAAEARSAGGEAVAAPADVADPDAAAKLVGQAVEWYGRIDAVVNNAGIVRDRMIVSMSADEWDAVMAVHLRGTFNLTKHAAATWRERSKAGESPNGRIVNTTSGAGIFGSVGQANYSAAKAGIAAFTLVAAAELGRYGATVNAIAPAARTAMTEEVFAEMMAKPDEGFDRMDPANVSPLVAWLVSEDAGDVTGRIFEVDGGRVCVCNGWTRGPEVDVERRWDPAELADPVRKLLADAPAPVPVYGA